jgi:hypothetical protein
MTDELPQKTRKKAAREIATSEAAAPHESSNLPSRAIPRAAMRTYYVRIMRFLLGTRRRMFVTLGVLVLLIGLFFWHHATTQPSQAQLLVELSQVMIIPHEQPQIAVVTDAATLKTQQPFYSDARNGDVLFLFPQAGKAMLFRPSTHQLVNAGPVDVPSPPRTKS